MKALTAAALAAIALTGCATAPSEHNAPVSGGIIWTIHRDLAALEGAHARLGGEAIENNGFSFGFVRSFGALPAGVCFVDSLPPGSYAGRETFGGVLAEAVGRCAGLASRE